MIRALQKKFVITAMLAITVLLLILLGAINIFNIIIVGHEVERTLLVISDSEGRMGELRPKPEYVPPEIPIGAPKNDYDTFMSANFFVVRFDADGDILDVDVSRTSVVTEETAKELAVQACLGGAGTGRIQRFRYRVQETNLGKTAVFLDASGESLSYIRVLLLSGTIGILCWGLMLVFVVLLSRRAIRPIAENIEKQKQFVTNAGHEIKTPLAIIQSNTEAMELYQGENKWSRNIKEQTIRLNGLMNHLLMLARMEEGTAVPASDFSLSEKVEEALQSFAQPMEVKHILLTPQIEPGVLLHADPVQIEQLLSILMDNAVKYANEGGEIRIRLQRSEKRIRLQVENTCDALPDVPADKLFDRFYRGDAARTQKNGGYGIGLAAARSIASSNHGSIDAEYIGPGRVCFTVRFS